MTFSSLSFLFYFLPAALILYYAFFFSRTLKNLVMLVCSLVFYAWGEPGNFVLLLVSILVNYLLGLLIGQDRKKSEARFWLIVALLFNIGMLFVFKYLSFVVQNINAVTGGQISAPSIALPIGISFFTFQAMAYVIDVYRRSVAAQTNLLHLALYFSFFPKLTQGPIVPYADFEAQIVQRRETLQKFSSGMCLLIVGLGKKVLIANSMAIVADRVFEIHAMGAIPVSLAWLGAIAYTFQIYFDFSGYSDMAVGLGLMFGFKLMQNFNYPYVSKSISEFWRRWHISLGAWFREYVYIPLGGSRMKNKDLVIRNLAVVWILTGIWHGANWTFLVWGVLNFICIASERVFGLEKSSVPGWLRHVYAMFVVIIGWVVFRSDSLQIAGDYIVCMFNPANGFASPYAAMFLREYGVFFAAALVFSMPVAPVINSFLAKGILLRQSVSAQPPYEVKSVYTQAPLGALVNVLYVAGIIALFLVCTANLVKGSYSPFIYFQF